MIYGAILEKGERFYTHLFGILNAIEPAQAHYNWLITDFECFPHDENLNQLLSGESCFFSGEELFEIVRRDDFQWVWGVFSAFDPKIPLEEILRYPLPYADGNQGFWKNPVSIQHPLAEVEIVAFDSTLTLFLSKEKDLVDRFRSTFPLSEDLSLWNETINPHP